MNNYSFIANFTKNLDQLNKWGIDSNELTYLVNSYGALTDIIEGTHDSIELIFHDVITGDQIIIGASIDHLNGETLIGYIPVNNK